MTDLVKYFNNSELSINLTSILILNDQTNEFEPWFIAKEVATLLGYTNASKAIGDHVDELDQKMLSYDECKVLFGQNILADETLENTDDFRGNDSLPRNNFLKINSNGMKFINESGLYTLIARSNKSEARKFQRWVTSEVLPSIRKTGSYNIQKSTPSYEIEDPIKRAKAWIAEQEAKLALEAENNELTTKNKALKADNDNLTQVLTDTSEKLITAIRTKAQINDKRTASLMGKVSGQSRKITKLENDLNTANDNINNLTIANNQLQEQLDDTYSSLYRDKRVAEIIKGKYEFITYKFNTLKPRVNKALKAIALALGESIKEKPNPMNDTYAPTLYFTKRTVDQLLDNIEKDHGYLKRFGK